eukprot:jgi/Bigna1/91051/estExt_fgenesh1_pg.C_870009
MALLPFLLLIPSLRGLTNLPLEQGRLDQDSTLVPTNGEISPFTVKHEVVRINGSLGRLKFGPLENLGTPKTHAFSVVWIQGKTKPLRASDFFCNHVVFNNETNSSDLGHGVRGIVGISENHLNSKTELHMSKLSGTFSREHHAHDIIPQVALTNAHLNAIEAFLAADTDYALIVEDGIRLSPSGQKELREHGGLFSRLEELVKAAPKGFHEINLGRCMAECFRQSVVVRARFTNKPATRTERMLFRHSSRIADEAGIAKAGAVEESALLARVPAQQSGGSRTLAFVSDADERNATDNTAAYCTREKKLAQKSFSLAWLYDKGNYSQYSVTPRLFDTKQVPKICSSDRKCHSINECGIHDIFTRGSCQFQPPCEASGNCFSLDVADPVAFRFDFLNFKGFSKEKVGKLGSLRGMLKQKHFRVRVNYRFSVGCGFFTYFYVALTQLQFALKHDLIGDKAPIIYMPESHHYHSCVNHTTSTAFSQDDFWHRYFEQPGPLANPDSISEEDVWELSQDSILTSHYDRGSVHAYPYPGDDLAKCDQKWMARQRAEAIKVMERYIHVKRSYLETARKAFRGFFPMEQTEGVLGVHMRGTDKFVNPKVSANKYVLSAGRYMRNHQRAGMFLATDDESYLRDFEILFPDVVTRNVSREALNVLYDDHVDKIRKSEDVLFDALCLAQTSHLLKPWSGVSEFAVYLRSVDLRDSPPFDKVEDLEDSQAPKLSLSNLGNSGLKWWKWLR